MLSKKWCNITRLWIHEGMGHGRKVSWLISLIWNMGLKYAHTYKLPKHGHWWSLTKKRHLQGSYLGGWAGLLGYLDSCAHIKGLSVDLVSHIKDLSLIKNFLINNKSLMWAHGCTTMDTNWSRNLLITTSPKSTCQWLVSLVDNSRVWTLNKKNLTQWE
jgi:hypothetical protein